MTQSTVTVAAGSGSGRRRVWPLFIVVLAACVGAMALLYETLRRADDDLNLAILGAAQDEARLIASSLTPLLMRDDLRTVGAIDVATREMAGHGRTLRVIRGARPERGDPAYLVAAHPSVTDGDFAAIRAKLEASESAGLDRTRCAGSARLAERLEAHLGTPEILAAATLVPAGGYCWTILVGWTAAPLIASSIGRPYWQTPEARRGAMILGALVAVVLGALLVLWRAVRLAQRGPMLSVRRSEPDLAAPPGAPPTADPAPTAPAAIDPALARLREAAQASLSDARAPLASLDAALESLRTGFAAGDSRAGTAIDAADRALARLRRRLDESDALDGYCADLAHPRRDVVDLRKHVADIVFDFHAESTGRGLSLSYEALTTAPVLGTARLIDGVVTTLIEEALRACRAGDVLRIVVRVNDDAGEAQLAIDVPDHRPGSDPGVGAASTAGEAIAPNHAALALAARHVAAMGGRLVIDRGEDRLVVTTAHWPLALSGPLATADAIIPTS
ncbi:MAG: hypothetical protein JNK67_12495 [Alphaproteobacteria bacterium]|nr:hypothetical protein [Alphaproteobacteria bacterium]